MHDRDDRPDDEFVRPSDDLDQQIEQPDESDPGQVADESTISEVDDATDSASEAVSAEPVELDAPVPQLAEDPSVVNPPREAASEPAEPATLPLMDNHGNTPTDFQDILQSLRLWEEAAAEAGDDPLFTPKPTSRSRGEVMLVRRGPGDPHVWLEHGTMRPVRYAGDVDTSLPTDPTPQFTISPPSEEPLEPAGDAALMRPELVVTVGRAPHHFLAALETRAARIDRRIEQITDQRIVAERRWQEVEERRINGYW